MRALKKISLTAAALCGLLCARPASPESQSILTLDDAVNLALAHNYSLETAMLKPKKARDEIAAFSTQRLPQFRFTALAGELLNHPTVTVSKGLLGTLSNGLQVPRETVH